MSFLAMPVDEHVATEMSKPDSTGVPGIPTLVDDYRIAKAKGIRLWLICESTRNSDGSHDFVFTAITQDEFTTTYRIDAHAEFPNDWCDVSKI